MTNIQQENLGNNLNDEMSLKELVFKAREWWNYLLSKWLIIVCFGLLGSTSGFVYAYLNKPIYTATTTFVLEEGEKASGLGGSLGGLASMAGIDLSGGGGGIFQGDNILQLYKSRTMIEKTLFTKVNINGKDELLIDRYIDFNKLRKAWSKSQNLKMITFDEPTFQNRKFTRIQDSIIGVIATDINNNFLSVIKPDKKLSIIQANVRSKDEVFAKNFNDAIVKNVNDFYVQTKTKKSTDNIRILQHKTDSVRLVMNNSIYSAVAIADATPNLNPTKQVQRMVPAQKSQFSAETNKAALTSLIQNLEMSKIALLKDTPLIQVVDAPIYPLKMDKIGKTKGVLFGGILSGFIILFFLIVKRIYNKIIGV